MRIPLLEKALEKFLNERTDEPVFLRREFAAACPRYSRDGVNKALRRLIDRGVLLRFGYGLLVRTRPSAWTGEPLPATGSEACALAALRKLGVNFRPGKAFRDYNERKTTQVPARLVLDVGRSRITRKIGAKKKAGVIYERSVWQPPAVS